MDTPALTLIFEILVVCVIVMVALVLMLRRDQRSSMRGDGGPAPALPARPALKPSAAVSQAATPAGLPPADRETQLRALIVTGRKIEAIKAYREMTGLGLKEAKDAVEIFAAGDWSALDPSGLIPPARPEPQKEAPAGMQQVEALVRERQLIEAIKVYRSLRPCSLKEAKEAVEAIQTRLQAR